MHAWDLFLEAETPDAQIAQGLGAALGVSPQSVHIIDRIEPDLDVPAGTTALVERSAIRGDAHRHLTLYLQDEGLIGRTKTRPETIRLLRDLAQRLGTSIFVGDGELDPSGFLRIRPDGAVEAVAVDDEQLDAAGFFSVLSDRAPIGDDLLTARSGELTHRPSTTLER
jgi:hypothetical protein